MLVSIGFGNMVSKARVVSILTQESAPIKRIVAEARSRSMLVDATFGRKTKSVLVMDSGHIVLSALAPETLANRFNQKENEEE